MLDFDLTEEQRLLEQSVREWAAREVAPRMTIVLMALATSAAVRHRT
jgi:hypothetical protein